MKAPITVKHFEDSYLENSVLQKPASSYEELGGGG